MKRILVTLMVLAAVLSIAGAGSFAYFVDTETSAGNTFTAGVWDLGIDGEDTNEGTLVISGVSANQTGTQTWVATNTGTVPAYLDLNISLAPSGELVDHLTAHLYIGVVDIYPTGAIKRHYRHL